jgi:hypothetical protein
MTIEGNVFANSLNLQRWMRGIALEQFEFLFCNFAQMLGQGVVQLLKFSFGWR